MLWKLFRFETAKYYQIVTLFETSVHNSLLFIVINMFFSDITNIALVFNASLETLGIGKILLSINALSNILPSMCETDL